MQLRRPWRGPRMAWNRGKGRLQLSVTATAPWERRLCAKLSGNACTLNWIMQHNTHNTHGEKIEIWKWCGRKESVWCIVFNTRQICCKLYRWQLPLQCQIGASLPNFFTGKLFWSKGSKPVNVTNLGHCWILWLLPLFVFHNSWRVVKFHVSLANLFKCELFFVYK